MKNVVLIGMPGCGKSTVGVLLAKAMGWDFVDTDLLIQVTYGDKLQNLIDRHGTERFLKLEEQAVCALEADSTVIATGGSVVYSASAMKHLRQNGIVVYLKQPYEEIQRRLKDFSRRGIALKPGQTLHDLFLQRVPLYEAACDVTFEQPEGRIEDAVEALCHQVRMALK